MSKWFKGAMFAGLLCGALVWFWQGQATPQTQEAPPVPRPVRGVLHGVTFHDDQGKGYTIADFSGKKVIMNFWNVWCGPCIAEMPSFLELQNQMKSHGVEIITIILEPTTRAAAVALGRQGLGGLRVFCDGQGDAERILNIRAIPLTLIVNEKGRILQYVRGARDWGSPEVINDLKRLWGIH